MELSKRIGSVTPRVLVGLVGAVVGLGALTWASAQDESGRVLQDAQTGSGSEQSDETISQVDIGAMAAMAARGGGGGARAGDLPAWKDVSEGFERVVSTTDPGSFYQVWRNNRDNRILAEMPRGFESQKHFFAMTVAGGEIFAGLQAGDLYCYWKRIGNRLALISPQISVRSTGDAESRDSVNMIFTDRVILDVPVVSTGPSGQPVIDLNNLLLGNASSFFGRSAAGARVPLAEIASTKAFPKNIEIAYKVPVGDGTIKTLHYSISLMEGSRGYQPRRADERVGYFTTSYRDLGKFDRDDVNVRYINRWHLEKADPKLKMSPPKQPIVWYVEHTVPIRYRRYVREGIEYWNKAFEQIGIVNALEVRFQDKASGSHMEKDPEDVRYNFIRWLSNDVSTAIGPSRVNPMTGEILDADVVLTDGWIRVFTYQWNDLMPKLATEGMSPQTLEWLESNPTWDPRVRLADPMDRDRMLIAHNNGQTTGHFVNNPLDAVDGMMLGSNPFDGLVGRVSQVSGCCEAAHGKALSLASLRMHLMFGLPDDETPTPEEQTEIPAEMLEMLKQHPELLAMMPADKRDAVARAIAKGVQPESDDEPKDDEPKTEEEPKPRKAPEKKELIDGVPEEFVGPSLAELVAHEVGHCLGLRHNFKGSSAYQLSQINSTDMKGNEPFSTTVMDYNPVNIRMPGFGDAQGDYAVIDIGPYDKWAIEFGYGFGDTTKILGRASDPLLQYGTDEDTWGPDPLARRYDLSANPLDYANNQMALVRHHREKLLTEFVKDGQSWSRTRYGYQITLGQQVQAISMMANWVGGAHVYRDKKGDPNGRAPIDVVPAARQREALEFVIRNSFHDEVYGLSPDLLKHMTIDKWYDEAGMSSIFTDPTFDVHDRVSSVQASVLTMLMNPQTLRRVYDNEFFVPADQDALTLAELLSTISEAAWGEIAKAPTTKTTERSPMISSLRRGLQREHVQRLIDLSTPSSMSVNPASRAVSTLAMSSLRDLKSRVDKAVSANPANIDAYSKAHLEEIRVRIEKALDAQFVYGSR